MSVIERLRMDLLVARKEKSSEDLVTLSTLVGECEQIIKRIGGKATDDALVRHIRSVAASCEMTINLLEERGQPVSSFKNELVIYNRYIPVQLTRAQIVEEIEKLFQQSPNRSLGQIHKHFGQSFPQQYSGDIVSNVFKELSAKYKV